MLFNVKKVLEKWCNYTIFWFVEFYKMSFLYRLYAENVDFEDNKKLYYNNKI